MQLHDKHAAAMFPPWQYACQKGQLFEELRTSIYFLACTLPVELAVMLAAQLPAELAAHQPLPAQLPAPQTGILQRSRKKILR